MKTHEHAASHPAPTQHHAPPRNLAWLDQLTASLPGFGGYDRHASRRASAFALRDALIRSLQELKSDLRLAIHSCQKHEAISEIAALERLDHHTDRILERLAKIGFRVDSFYLGPDLDDPHRLDTIYIQDLRILETADHLAGHFKTPDKTHDRLAEIEAHLVQLEHQLDERVRILQALMNVPHPRPTPE
jgi:hypothetical protein